jgi:lipopolysaccharide exporter
MIKSNSFIKDILTLSSVPLLSQVLGLLLTPIVTRLYAPEEFGLLNSFSSITAFLCVFATLAFHSSILLPKKDTKAFNMLVVCLLSTVFFTIISYFLIFFFEDFILEKLNIIKLKNYIFLIPLFVLLHGTFQTLRFWNTRFKNFKTIAASKASEVITNKTTVLGLGFSGYVSGGSLIYGVLMASIIKNTLLLLDFKKQTYRFTKISWFDIKSGFKRYIKFPKYSLWSELLSRTPALIIVFLILKYFDSTVLGYYGLCIMVLTLPTVFITSSIMEAFSPRAAEAKHTNTHLDLLKLIYERVVSLTIFPFLILGIYGDVLFGYFFGIEWAEAGLIAQILVFRIFCEIIFNPIISLTVIIEKQEINLIRRISDITVITLSLLIGGYYQNYYLAFFILSFTQGLVTSFIGIYLLKIMELEISEMISKTKYYFKLVLIFSIFLIGFRTNLDTSFITLILILFISTILYYSLVFRHDKVLFLKLKNIIINKKI